ncbi:MAG: hypothetical protein ACE37H_15850 [Phycisphaeraceae bacterium]
MKKPASITVLGILNLVFAGLGILGGCYGLFSPIVLKHSNPALAEAYTGTFLLVTVLFILLGLGSKTLMALSGYGLIKGEAWGRKVGRVWAVVSIVLGLSMLVANVTYLMPITMDAMEKDLRQQSQGPGQPAMPSDMIEMVKTITYVSTIGGGLATATIYQVTFLVMMNRKPVNDYFARRDADPTHGG